MTTRMIKSVVMVAMVLASSAFAQYRHHGSVQLPSSSLTPGAVDPAMTKAKLCDPKFRTGAVRLVTEKTKKQACAEYGLGEKDGCPGKGFEIDHLVSLELGGTNDIKNLWPQRAPEFHWKDALEDHLAAMVCKGEISLAEAQHAIRADWYAEYLKLGLDKGKR